MKRSAFFTAPSHRNSGAHDALRFLTRIRVCSVKIFLTSDVSVLPSSSASASRAAIKSRDKRIAICLKSSSGTASSSELKKIPFHTK